jgi:murein DD-endopeptidase MepM/ murein hydrolase activator NlpD
MNRKYRLRSSLLPSIVGIAGLLALYNSYHPHVPQETAAPASSVSPGPASTHPIFDLSRVSKKFFGTYVTPKNSPVQPEKFTGYHAGIDFETTAAEADIDVPVPALFDGKIVLKKYTAGYGGVLVEESAIEGQLVTIVYGHLKLPSITGAVGQYVKKGDRLGILGKGYSTETDGERKHLHLGIHLGPSINILGYVQTESQLSGWLDPIQFLK